MAQKRKYVKPEAEKHKAPAVVSGSICTLYVSRADRWGYNYFF